MDSSPAARELEIAKANNMDQTPPIKKWNKAKHGTNSGDRKAPKSKRVQTKLKLFLGAVH